MIHKTIAGADDEITFDPDDVITNIEMVSDFRGWFICLCSTSHQQLRSYGLGVTTKPSPIDLRGPGSNPQTLVYKAEWFIYYTTSAPIGVCYYTGNNNVDHCFM